MNNIRRSVIFTKPRLINILKPSNGAYGGLADFSSKLMSNTAVDKGVFDTARRAWKSGCLSQIARTMPGANGISVLNRGKWTREVTASYRTYINSPCFIRPFSSTASERRGENQAENKKDVTTIEDPFDSPTYNIPEKPVSFAEGASYSLIILAGLGVAALAGYAVFKELIFQPKEYKIFGKALDRVQNDSQVRVRIGSPITGYGQESRNRAARQRIPNRMWTDENGVEHVEINFHIRGPHGAGVVYAIMHKDKADKQWKYTSLIVQIKSPSPTQLILESYIPR